MLERDLYDYFYRHVCIYLRPTTAALVTVRIQLLKENGTITKLTSIIDSVCFHF